MSHTAGGRTHPDEQAVCMSIRNVIFDLGGVLVLTHWDRVTGPLSELSGLSPEAVMDAIATGTPTIRSCAASLAATSSIAGSAVS